MRRYEWLAVLAMALLSPILMLAFLAWFTIVIRGLLAL
jgi:hypothetical protein